MYFFFCLILNQLDLNKEKTGEKDFVPELPEVVQNR